MKNPHISSSLGFSKCCEYIILKFDEQKALYAAPSKFHNILFIHYRVQTFIKKCSKYAIDLPSDRTRAPDIITF